MKMYQIEVDEKVWRYLQKHAEPFIDTPNSVLSRLLLATSQQAPGKERASNGAADYRQFMELLKSKFSRHAQIIDTYFESLMMGAA
jgi:hypothetical protein